MPASAFATVNVSTPLNGATVSSIVPFAATANSGNCALGVAAMGIYVDDRLSYVTGGATLNTNLPISTGTHRTTVQAWDFCGGASVNNLTLTVGTQQSGISVTSPVSGATVGPVNAFVATASTSCPQGVSAVGVYVNHSLAYVAQGSSLNTQITLTPGTQNTVVQAWDNCGSTTSTPVPLTVTGTKLSNLQSIGGWNQWGELGPVYDICSPCSGVSWSMNQHVSSNSLSGNATQFTLGGTTPYSDVLWSNPLIGQGSTLGMPDTNHTLLPTIHHLTYDTDVFVTNFAVTQDLEFDVNMFMNGLGMEWGTECNHLDHKVWDIWDNVNATWVPTNVPCSLNDKSWNHVTFDVSRGSDNSLTYNTITVNGVTSQINQTVPPFTVPSSWYGMTVNYQMDGNYNQSSNTTYLDNLTVTYW
jgi:hypothetical protein